MNKRHRVLSIVAIAAAGFSSPELAAQSVADNGEPFVTTYGEVKNAELPLCGKLPPELKTQLWFGTPEPFSDERYVALFGEDAAMFGVQGVDWWYMRGSKEVLPRETAAAATNLEFAKFFNSDDYDNLPILCGVVPEKRLAEIRAKRAEAGAIAAAEAAPKAVDPNCQFCELPGGEYLNAIYEGNYEKQDKMAWDYLMEIRRNDTNDAMLGVFMQNFGMGSEDLTVLQELLANYMRKYAYHEGRCLEPGNFERVVTWDTPDVVTTMNGFEFARKEGLHLSARFRLNAPFFAACTQLCGDAGSMTMTAHGLNMTRTRYSLMDIFEGLDAVFEQYDCADPVIKKFETNLLAMFDQENRTAVKGKRNTLLDVAFVPDEVPDPTRFEPDETVFPEMAERRKLVPLEGDSAKAKGSRFLVTNSQVDGVQISDTGLQYQILNPGSGKAPNSVSNVTFHYRMSSVDGNVMADTWASGQPATAIVHGLVEGWAEGITLLKPGGEARLVIPPYLAYGDQEGIGLEPGSVLVFDIELLSVD